LGATGDEAKLLTGERIDGADVAGLPLPGRFGITDAGSLLRAAL
jgi:hypothetical protein